jgi:hypothetical protein
MPEILWTPRRQLSRRVVGKPPQLIHDVDLDRNGTQNTMSPPAVGQNPALDDILDNKLWARWLSVSILEAHELDQTVRAPANIALDVKVVDRALAPRRSGNVPMHLSNPLPKHGILHKRSA